MIYSSPVPAEMIAGSFYEKLGTPFYLSPDKIESDYARVRFERELKLFRSFCQRGDVLDVGSSTGAFLYQLHEIFPGDYKSCGIEISKPALAYARSRGIEIIEESFLDFDLRDRHFDAITFWAVMEHLVDAKKFLAKASTLLRPGGHCFILVPNLKSLAIKILGAKYRYILPQHVNYFSAETLKKLAQTEPSLEIVVSGAMHFNPLVILQDFFGSGEFVSDKNRADLLQRTTAYKQNSLLKPVKWAYDGVEQILGAFGLADNLFIVLRRK
ncbi:MAG: class I SAM-dependent methyltransferase [Limisphaerales bacterium]